MLKSNLIVFLEQSSRIHIGLKKYIAPKNKVMTDTQLMMTRYEEKQEEQNLNKNKKKAIHLITEKILKLENKDNGAVIITDPICSKMCFEDMKNSKNSQTGHIDITTSILQ